MARYNADLDKCLDKNTLTVDGNEIYVSVYSYNGGKPKIRVQRKGWKTPTKKIGSMTASEAAAVSAAIVSALSKLNK